MFFPLMIKFMLFNSFLYILNINMCKKDVYIMKIL